MLHYRPHPGRRPGVLDVRLLSLVLGTAGLALVLVTGLALTGYHLAHPSGAHRQDNPSPTLRPPEPVNSAVARARDALAARPMPQTGTGHEFGGPQLSTRDPGPALPLPPAQDVDELGVQLGFPRTPAGALAQLTAIDTAALQSGGLPRVREIITAWAAPGGPTARSWSGIQAMTSLLDSAGLPGSGSASLQVVPRPAMGLIKGTVGTDFVVACVDFSIDITYGGTTTTVAVDCQRMLWHGGRWVIGPGPEPAPAEQVWPDTDAAIDAGFRDLTWA